MKPIQNAILRRMNLAVAGMAMGLSVISLGITTVVFASPTSKFTQQINAGTLATDIRSNSTTAVSNPNVALSAVNSSFNCQTTTGTFGTASERIYVDNLSAADNGWSLTIAASAPTDTWASSTAAYFDFNDSTGSGCSDGADTDSYGGQMSISAGSAATTADYASGSSTTGITTGPGGSFVETTTNTLTLAAASNSAPKVWRGYFTNFSITQKVPAEQAHGSYTINLTLTATAL